jgi:hypothetical protein
LVEREVDPAIAHLGLDKTDYTVENKKETLLDREEEKQIVLKWL